MSDVKKEALEAWAELFNTMVDVGRAPRDVIGLTMGVVIESILNVNPNLASQLRDNCVTAVEMVKEEHKQHTEAQEDGEAGE